MIENILPIRYINSTGGHFIACFLSAARDNRPCDLILSRHGNTHGTKMDFNIVFWNYDQQETKNLVYSKTKEFSQDSLYFLPIHCKHPLVYGEFRKWININYSLKSIFSLVKVFEKKWAKDCENMASEELKQAIANQTKLYFNRLELHAPLGRSDVLDLNWELDILGPYEDLIEKLSNWTSISRDNFDRRAIDQWQTITKNLIL